MFKPEQAVPVACTSPAWVMVDHLVLAEDKKKKTQSILSEVVQQRNEGFSEGDCVELTSTSHKALLLVAEVADWRPVVLRKTYCFFL